MYSIMYKSEIILLIMTCYKYKNKTEIQRQSWLKELPENMIFYHVLGDKDKCKGNKYLFDENNHILYVATNDDYNSLPHKVIQSFEAVSKQYDYKYIFKTDDDQMLVRSNFFVEFTKLLSQKKDYHYGGNSISIEDHISSYHNSHSCLPKDLLLKKTVYCNGRFYFLSKDAVEYIVSFTEQIKKHYIEDHAIGLYLDDRFKGKHMLSFDTHKHFHDDDWDGTKKIFID